MTLQSSQMTAILDTHALLWFAQGDPRLPLRIRRLIEQSGPELYVSVASIWEIVIKVQKRTLTLSDHPKRWIPHALQQIGARAMTIRARHALGVLRLPVLHHDPFDRLIISQASAESLPVVTHDPMFARYPIKVLW
jgi:PIN domain nuclease of toxin-antitoxin system